MNLDSYLDSMFLFLGIIYLSGAFYIFYRFTRQRQIWKIYTILYLTSYSYILVFCYFYFSVLPRYDPAVLLFNIPALFILTSSAFLATRIIVYPEYRYSLGNLVHFIPALAISVYLYFEWPLSIQEKTQWFAIEHLNIFLPADFMNVYMLLCLFDILFYLGFQILEIILKLIFKKDLQKNKTYKSTITQLLVIRGLNLGLPIMIYIEIVFSFSLQVIKLTGIFLAINSMMLTLFMAVYSLVFKVPRNPEQLQTSETFIDDIRWNQVKNTLENAMSESKLFKDEKLTLPILSQMIGVSPRLLSEYINQIMKITFPEYLVELRINEAKRLFESTEMSVTEVSFSCGFNSASKFFEHFHKKTGFTPAQYKKKIRQTSQNSNFP